MLLATQDGQPINLIITKTPRNIPAGNGFKRSNNLGFFVKNNGDDKVTLTVIGVNDDTAVETSFFPGWNLEMIKEITSVIAEGSNLQWGE
jgi:hypothetical protein